MVKNWKRSTASPRIVALSSHDEIMPPPRRVDSLPYILPTGLQRQDYQGQARDLPPSTDECQMVRADPTCSWRGHDVGFEARDGGQELVLLFLWHLELVESGDQVPDRNLPIALGDAETLVRCLHAAPDINTRPAGCRANLIHH